MCSCMTGTCNSGWHTAGAQGLMKRYCFYHPTLPDRCLKNKKKMHLHCLDTVCVFQTRNLAMDSEDQHGSFLSLPSLAYK